MADATKVRIESELEVIAYIQNLKYVLKNGTQIIFQVERMVDMLRDERFTNRYTIENLFPREDMVEVLRRELATLTVADYIRTVKDLRYPKRSEMREFGKIYNEKDDVYIKIRVELLGQYGEGMIFIMSFHFAERPLVSEMFPYKKKEDEKNENTNL